MMAFADSRITATSKMASALTGIGRKFFGSKNDREIKRLRPDVEAVNRLEPEIETKSQDEMRARIAELKAEISAIEDDEQRADRLDDILPEVFAIVREAAKRVLGQRHFDVQLIGGMVLHSGRIAEMKTGEGKTLVATLPAVLNALSGRGVHVVTVNDYLARRDSEWMGRIYGYLGLSVGVIVHGVTDQERKLAYVRRYHLRPEQRVRLRLPARQHEVQSRRVRPARAQLRDRGRG